MSSDDELGRFEIRRPSDDAGHAPWMEYAKWLEAEIGPPRRHLCNPTVGGSPLGWRKYVEFCVNSDELLGIYRRFGKKELGISLVKDLLLAAENVLTTDARLGLRLLLSHNFKTGYSQKRPYAVEQSKYANLVRKGLSDLPLIYEFDFHHACEALETLRRLAPTEVERRELDCSILMGLLLAAETTLPTNPGQAIHWQSRAARIAQDRLGDSQLASKLVERTQEMRARPGGAAEPENSRRIREDLEAIWVSEFERQHSESFIADAESVVHAHTDDAEPAAVRIRALITDTRLLVDYDEVQRRVAARRGLSTVIPVVREDSRGNVRGPDDGRLSFLEQNVAEIVTVVKVILTQWTVANAMPSDAIVEHLRACMPGYDWRFVERAIERHFAEDYYSAVHLLIPQLEALTREKASKAGLATTVLDDQGRESVVSLSQLLREDQRDVQILLGQGLFWLALVFLVESRTAAFNFRNEVAHGTLTPEECVVGLSAFLLFLLLHIASLDTTAERESPDAAGTS